MFKQLSSLLFSNRTLRQTILKNTFWLGVSQIASRVIRAILVIYAARLLGASGYGVFSYAIAIAGLANIFSDLGINSIFIREVSRKSSSLRSKYLSTAFALKLALLSFLFLIIVFIVPHVTQLPGAKALLPLIACLFLFDGLRDFGFSFIRAIERMELEAAVSLWANTAIVALSLGFLLYSPTPYYLALGYATGSALGLGATIYVLRGNLRELILGCDRVWVRPILRSAWPFAILSFLGAVLMYSDILMLSWMRTAPELGFYSAAQKPVQLLSALPFVVAASFFPVMARLADTNKVRFRLVMEQALTMVMSLALPFIIGGILLGDQLTTLLYGHNYAASIPVFQILMVSLIVTFPSAIINHAILAYDIQGKFVGPVIGGAFINIALNYLLIPRWGIIGAASATLLAQLISQGFIYYQLRARLGFQLLVHIKKIMIATLGMGFAIIGLRELGVNFWLSFISAVVAYLSLLILLKEPLIDKLRSILIQPTD